MILFPRIFGNFNFHCPFHDKGKITLFHKRYPLQETQKCSSRQLSLKLLLGDSARIADYCTCVLKNLVQNITPTCIDELDLFSFHLYERNFKTGNEK